MNVALGRDPLPHPKQGQKSAPEGPGTKHLPNYAKKLKLQKHRGGGSPVPEMTAHNKRERDSTLNNWSHVLSLNMQLGVFRPKGEKRETLLPPSTLHAQETVVTNRQLCTN